MKIFGKIPTFAGMTSKFGLILTEAMLAISTLTTGVLVTSTIVNNAISTTVISRDYLVAQNLATEGMEILENIKDNNWLNFPDQKSTCWMAIKNNDCTAKVIGNHNYSLQLINGAWSLQSYIFTKLNLDVNSPNNLKYALVPKTTILSDGSVMTRYEPYEVGFSQLSAIKFYRAVKSIEVDSGKATFEIKIQWKDGARTRTIKNLVTLYNYLE